MTNQTQTHLIHKHALYETSDVMAEIALIRDMVPSNNKDKLKERLEELLTLISIRESAGDGPLDDVTHWF